MAGRQILKNNRLINTTVTLHLNRLKEEKEKKKGNHGLRFLNDADPLGSEFRCRLGEYDD